MNLNTYKPPAVSTLERLEKLPLYSIIDADGILFERGLSDRDGMSIWLELGSGLSGEWSSRGEFFKDGIAEGKVFLLRVGTLDG